MRELRDRCGAVAADPVAEFYSWLTRGFIGVRDVGFGFPLFFALLIETVSAFGPATIAAYAETSHAAHPGVPRLAVTSHDAPRLAVAGDGTLRRDVLEWFTECAVSTESNRALGLSEMYADFGGIWGSGKRIGCAVRVRCDA